MTVTPSARVISYHEALPHLNWPDAVEALRRGHAFARAEIADVFLGPATGTMMSRSAFIPDLGYGAKSFTVFNANSARSLPTVQGAMLVFDPDDGRLTAVIESALITEYKTAADSVLGAMLLARHDSTELLIVGAGTVATSLAKAYAAVFPKLSRIRIWARRFEQAQDLARRLGDLVPDIAAVADLPTALSTADIVSSATMARQPVISGDWVRPGTHVDLIGAFKADMREADDTLMARAKLFVDSRETTAHIGELILPLASGAISSADILGDFYDLVRPDAWRRSPDDITVFKNGGGAHLDLMMAVYIANAVS